MSGNATYQDLTAWSVDTFRFADDSPRTSIFRGQPRRKTMRAGREPHSEKAEYIPRARGYVFVSEGSDGGGNGCLKVNA